MGHDGVGRAISPTSVGCACAHLNAQLAPRGGKKGRGANIPEDTRDIFTRGEKETPDVLIRAPVDWSREKEIFYCRADLRISKGRIDAEDRSGAVVAARARAVGRDRAAIRRRKERG